MDGVHNTYIRLNPYGHFHETDINAAQKGVIPDSKFISQFHHFLYLSISISSNSKKKIEKDLFSAENLAHTSDIDIG